MMEDGEDGGGGRGSWTEKMERMEDGARMEDGRRRTERMEDGED